MIEESKEQNIEYSKLDQKQLNNKEMLLQEQLQNKFFKGNTKSSEDLNQ